MVRRHSWLVVGTGLSALVCVLIAGIAGYWHYANQWPRYPAPPVVMPVPNAFDDYVAAGQMCQAAGGATVSTPLQPGSRVKRAGASAPPGYPGGPPLSPNGRQIEAYEPGVPLAQVRAVVARNRPALARLRRGFRKQYRSPPVVSVDHMFPELAQYRELARVLVTEGKLAEREGRWADAARSYLDCLRLGTDVPRGGALIHGLVGIAICRIGLMPLQALAPRLDGPAAAAAAREMARLDARSPRLAETLANEKEFMTASLLQSFRRYGGLQQLAGQFSNSGSGTPSAAGLLAALQFEFTPKRRILDNIRGYMDAMIADARNPYSARTPPPALPGDPLSQIVLPVFGNVRSAWAKRDAQWRTTELRLATRAYQQQHGASPPSPAALVPAYLPAVPEDPYSPKPPVPTH